MNIRFVSVIVASQLITYSLLWGQEFRTWKSADGKFAVSAKLIDYSDKEVRLSKENNKLITVPISKISGPDRKQLSRNRDYIYRVPDGFMVRNPSDSLGWRSVGKIDIGGKSHTVLSSGTSIQKESEVITLVGGSLGRKVNEAQQMLLATLAIEQTLETMRQEFKDVQADIDVTGKPESRTYRASGVCLTKDGAKAYIRIRLAFLGKSIYQVSALARNQKKANALASVIETIKPITNQ